MSALAVRELSEVSKRVDNAALLEALPDLAIDPSRLVEGLDVERTSR